MLEGVGDGGVGEGAGVFGWAFDGLAAAAAAFFAGCFAGGGAVAFFGSGFFDDDFAAAGFAFGFGSARRSAFATAFTCGALAAGFFGGAAAFFDC